MASVNKVIIVGNLGKDPEVRYLPNGDAVANISVATTDKYKDKTTGELREITEWHRISFFGRLAEVVGQYLKKGSTVYVEGSLRTRKWMDKEGQERYSTDIKADNMQMLGGTQGGGGNGGGREENHNQAAPAARPPQRQNQVQPPAAISRPTQAASSGSHDNGFNDMDDDIPF